MKKTESKKEIQGNKKMSTQDPVPARQKHDTKRHEVQNKQHQ